MATRELTFELKSLAETADFAQQVAAAIHQELEENQTVLPTIVICLNGSLGAGKTTFVSSLCVALGVNAEDVSSPTFSLQNIYSSL